MPLTYLVFDAVLLLDFVGIVVERLLLSTTRERICDTGKKVLARFRVDDLGFKKPQLARVHSFIGSFRADEAVHFDKSLDSYKKAEDWFKVPQGDT